ncbi:MAG: putative permease [Zhongshania sp.]
MSFLHLEGLERKVVLLQAASPVAVFNYLLAMQDKREPDVVAGVVVSSTLISFISIPILLFLGV